MRPRVVGVHGRGQAGELLLDRGVASTVVVAHPRKAVTDRALAGEHVGVLAGQVGKRGLEGQSELVGEPVVRGLERADDLATELDQTPVRELGLLDPPAGASTCLEHDHVGPARRQVARRRETGKARPDHNYVMRHLCSSRSSRSRSPGD